MFQRPEEYTPGEEGRSREASKMSLDQFHAPATRVSREIYWKTLDVHKLHGISFHDDLHIHSAGATATSTLLLV